MSVPKNALTRVVSGVVAAAVLLAVPAIAVCYGDLDVFAQETQLAPTVPAPVDGSVVLNNWQFTGHTRHHQTRHSHHPVHHTRPHHSKPTKPTKKTDHKSKHTCH